MTQGSSLSDLPEVMAAEYVKNKSLADGRIIGLKRLLFHWTIHVDIHEWGYEERYCFATFELADEAFEKWIDQEEPTNWHRHPTTARRRSIETGEIWIEP